MGWGALWAGPSGQALALSDNGARIGLSAFAGLLIGSINCRYCIGGALMVRLDRTLCFPFWLRWRDRFALGRHCLERRGH